MQPTEPRSEDRRIDLDSHHKMGNRKGNRALREVFPLSRTHFSVRSQPMRTRSECGCFVPTSISAAAYWTTASGGALCRPHELRAVGESVNGSTVA